MHDEGKVALVTGGARRLGRRIAMALAGRGYAVGVNHSSSEDEAREVVEEIRSGGGRALALRADVSSPPEVARMFDGLEQRLGPLNLLVNNAAVIPPSPFEKLDDDVWDKTLGVNLNGTMYCCREAGRRMLRRGGGTIVNIACLGAFQPWHGHIAYSVSKAGVVMLTRCLARALGPAVRVNAVAPGTVEVPGESSPTKITPPVDRIPLGRYASPDDIAGAVVHLAEAADYVTGQVLVVDGGTSLQSIW